jgi:serine/threonine-protein kinase
MGERFTFQGEETVLDNQTGLLWQRGGSGDRMVWKEGFQYIDELNQTQFAGYSDWRYPTKDELASLVTPEENRKTGLFVDSVFGTQRNCWTSTESEGHRAVYVDFYYGDTYLVQENYANYFVRAVRDARHA